MFKRELGLKKNILINSLAEVSSCNLYKENEKEKSYLSPSRRNVSVLGKIKRETV
jgi:hypothetical protein